MVPSGHFLLTGGTIPQKNQAIILLLKPEIQEKPLPQTGLLKTENSAGENGPEITAKATSNGEKAFYSAYPVNRSVLDFPETDDFSTPESAYAAINRVMAADDQEGWQRVSVKSLAERLSQEQNRKREIDPEWSKVVLNAKILEVRIKDDQAVVIAEFPQNLSSKPIKNPIDYRHLILEDGKWLNTGENRYDTIEQARTKFDQAIQSQLKTKQEYSQVLDNSEELVRLADELFDKLRKADYEKILSYYDEQTGKWSRDGWKKLGLDYMVHTNWPGFALWVCRTFQDNPIQSVELGEVFISDKQIAEEPNLPAVPYKVTLQDGGILSGDLYFYYSNEKWQPAEGLDWHLQKNPIKQSNTHISARPDLDHNFDMAQPWKSMTGNDSQFCKDFEEARSSDIKNSDGSAIAKYQQFMDKYPDSPANVHLLNLMSAVYLRSNQYDLACAALKQAIQIAGEDRFVNILEMNLANAERMAGDLATAEARLKRVMVVPVPETLEDSYAVTPQLFSAPFFLAEVYQKMGDPAKADNLLKQTAERAWQMTQDNPDIEWLPSWIGSAFQRRITLLLETEPENLEGRSLCTGGRTQGEAPPLHRHV